MGKILAFDYGLKRTGLAITDELKMIASPLTTVETLSILLDKIMTGGINREEIGEKARQKIIDVFNRNRMIDSLVNAYKQI